MMHGVDAVGEIVRQHRNRHDDSDIARGLESQTDGDSIQQTVQAEHAGGERSARRGLAVKQQDAIQHQVGQEIRAQSRQGPWPGR